MPVHRHLHNKRASVYTVHEELDAWRESRKLPTSDEKNDVSLATLTPGEAAEMPRQRRWFVLALLAALVATIGGLLWLQRTDRFWRNPIADARFEV